MIAYLQSKDVMVEVPDDITDAELADIDKNFSQYQEGESTPNAAAPSPAPTASPSAAEPKQQPEAKTQPNFFSSFIEPAMTELQTLGTNIALGPEYFAGATERGKAVAGKAAEELTFGLSKPLTDKLDENYKKHPVYAAAGQITGGLGSLMATGAAFRATELPVYAVEAGAGAAKYVAEAPRFIPPAIMNAATFGTRAFIKKTVESFQNGSVDVADFGASVVSETALGSLFGVIGGIASPAKAVTAAALAGYTATAVGKKGVVPPGIASAAGLGYLYSQMEGGDQIEAGLNASIWGLFELVGSYGREETLRRAAIHTLADSVGDYVSKKSPEIDPERARRIGHAVIQHAAAKHGGIDEIAKSGPEGTLGFIEDINQQVRNAKVPAPEPVSFPAEGAPAEGASGPSAGLPTDIQKPSAEIKIPPEIAATMPPEAAKAIEGAMNAAAGPQEPSVPSFKNTDEAVAYGAQIAGDTAKIGTLKQARADLEAQRNALKGIRGQAQERLNLSVKAQFLREAIETAEKMPPPLAKAVQTPPLPPREEEGEKSVKKAFPGLDSHKPAMDALIKDIEQVEATKYGPARDGDGNVVQNRVKLSGFTPEHLQGLDIEKAVDIPILQKALNGEPLTAKQHNRIVDLLEAKYKAEIKAGQEARPSETDEERAAMQGEDGGDAGFDPETFQDAETYPSSKPGKNRQYGGPEHARAQIEAKFGNFTEIAAITGGPEIVKLAKAIIGHVPTVKKVMRSLGYFQPSNEQIALWTKLFAEDPRLWKAVLLHEIGHAMDFQPDKTMARGNILGRIASLKNYRVSLLPESPGSGPDQQPLTDEERAKFRAEAEKMASGKTEPAAPEDPENQFDPQAILDVWNKATGDIHPGLLEYVKRLDTAQKKALVISAMKAVKNNEKITINDVKKFNKQAAADPGKAADIYKDLIRKEILRRKLWEEEVISQELKNLTQYWKPFDPAQSPGFTAYRFSSAELYADFISALLLAPGKAKEIAPNAFKAFFNYLQNKPDVMRALLEIQTLIQGPDSELQAKRYQDLLDMYESNEQLYRDRHAELEQSKKSVWDLLSLIFSNKGEMIYKEQRALDKKVAIAPRDDMEYAYEKLSQTSAFVRSHLWDFDNAVYKPMIQWDVMEPVKAILFLDRVGADRALMANPQGWTPTEAKELLDELKRLDPKKFALANQLAENARDWFKKLTMIDGAEDFFSKEAMSLIDLNDKYAPFLVTKYAKEYVSAGIYTQSGTLEDIVDPLTGHLKKGVSTLIAIERNRLTKTIGEGLLRSGAMVREAKIIRGENGRFDIEKPSDRNLGTIAWKVRGQWVAYHTDKFIADALKNETTEKIGLIGGLLNTVFFNNFFRSTYITFSPGFQFYNLIKDFMATWKNTPGLTLAKAFKYYIEATPHAKNAAAGKFDPIIQAMENEGALGVTFNDLILGRTAEDRELERVLEQFDIIEGREVKGEISKFLDLLRYSGDVIEKRSKIAAYMFMKEETNKTPEERAHHVINYAGTPNYKKKGLATPISNAGWLFSNIWLRGMENFIEIAFREPEKRKSFWTKTAMSTIAAKLLMALAAAGYFGKGKKSPQDMMGKASEYLKTNYTVIPLGIDDRGNGIMLTIPQDEASRLVGALFWKMLHHDGNLEKNLKDILSFFGGQVPGVAAGPVTAINWLTFLAGGQPRDPFRGQDILTDQEVSAGLKHGLEPMVRWTLNETGLFNLDVHDRMNSEPVYKTVESAIPVLNRFLRITKYGEQEKASEAVGDQASLEAKASLDMNDQAASAIKKGKSLADFMSTAKTPEEMKKMGAAYGKLEKRLFDDPYVQAALKATSNAQKKAAIMEGFKTFHDKEKGKEYVSALWANGVISDEVYNSTLLEIEK